MAAKNSVCPSNARKLRNGACYNPTTRKFVAALGKNASTNASRNASANATRNASANATPKKAAAKKRATKRSDSLSVSCGCTPARPKLRTGKRKARKAGK